MLRTGTMIVVLMTSVPILAQESPDGDEKSGRLRAMAKLAGAVEVGEGRLSPRLRAEPIFRYDDPPRGIQDATLWVWEADGRPVAAMKVERYPSQPPRARWVEGLVTLGDGMVSASWPDGLKWEARASGADRRAIPAAPAPAATASARLAQMKALARRFEAYEVDGPKRGRLQLRLLATPIHRFAGAGHGLIDGAVFVLAYGTNPEVLLIVEARRGDSGGASWSYRLARLGGAEASASLDGKEVWSVPYCLVPADQPTYTNRFVPGS